MWGPLWVYQGGAGSGAKCAPVDQSGAVMWSRERAMAWEGGMGGGGRS